MFQNLKNIPGWRSTRKLVIIECDDWGGIRMPSKKTYDQLISCGLKVNTGRYNMYDTLETAEDLEQLFAILDCVRDKNNKPAVMTPFVIVANPDFEKIKSTDFTEYYYEKFTDTLDRYYPESNVIKLWREGLDTGIFVPELHGREHITVQLWLEELRNGNKDLLCAFDNGFVSLDIPGILTPAREFRAEFYFTTEDQKPFLVNSIKEGVTFFREIFGYSPRVFVAGNNVFHPDFEKVLSETGVEFLNVSRSMPYPVEGGEYKYRFFIPGQKGPGGLIYYTRNCLFEPTDEEYKGIDYTIEQIACAFRWGKPANISTHRANFTGGIEPKNRTKGLTELKKLLTTIIKRWPDAEFMSSADALNHMKYLRKGRQTT